MAGALDIHKISEWRGGRKAAQSFRCSAGAEEIQSAYLRLIKRIHPDQGGTEGLASKLNAARDRLLGRL